MTGVLVVELVLALVAGVAHGLLPTGLDQAAAPVPIRRLPVESGVPLRLWWRMVRRSWRRGRRLRTLAAPVVVLLYVAAGVLRMLAVALRLADLGSERAARRLDDYSDDPMFPFDRPPGRRSLPPS